MSGSGNSDLIGSTLPKIVPKAPITVIITANTLLSTRIIEMEKKREVFVN